MSATFRQGISYTSTITMETEVCCSCGVAFGIPSDLRSKLLNDPNKYFYCPNGHSQHYSESKEARLRREAEKNARLANERAEAALRQKEEIEKQLLKAKRQLKRVEKGVCPCCNRTFQNLASHMKTKHPDIANRNEQSKKTNQQ